MTLNEELKDVVDSSGATGETRVPLDANTVSQLKKQVGVTSNTDIAPLVNAAIEEYLGNDEDAEDYEDEFKEEQSE